MGEQWPVGKAAIKVRTVLKILINCSVEAHLFLFAAENENFIKSAFLHCSQIEMVGLFWMERLGSRSCMSLINSILLSGCIMLSDKLFIGMHFNFSMSSKAT